MNFKKLDWRYFHGGMILFYIMGIVTFLVIGHLDNTLSRVLIGLFILIVIKEIVRFIIRWRKEYRV